MSALEELETARLDLETRYGKWAYMAPEVLGPARWRKLQIVMVQVRILAEAIEFGDANRDRWLVEVEQDRANALALARAINLPKG